MLMDIVEHIICVMHSAKKMFENISDKHARYASIKEIHADFIY